MAPRQKLWIQIMGTATNQAIPSLYQTKKGNYLSGKDSYLQDGNWRAQTLHKFIMQTMYFPLTQKTKNMQFPETMVSINILLRLSGRGLMR